LVPTSEHENYWCREGGELHMKILEFDIKPENVF
jgi:hypothetical protein